MLELYKGSVRFLLSQDELLGIGRPNREASQNARAKHFMSNLPSVGKDLTDAEQTLEAFKEDTPAFSEEQRKNMARAVTDHMDSDDAAATESKSQRHPHVHEYLSETLWKQLYASESDLSFDAKLELIVDFMLERLGLRFPDVDTLKSLLAIVSHCSGKEFSPDENYDYFQTLKNKFVNKRPLTPGVPLMLSYNRDVSQFIRLFPHQYLECDPPVASKVDDRKLQQRTRKDVMPCRSTNKHLAKNKQNKYSSASHAHDSGSDSVAMKCLDYILGNNNKPPAPQGRAGRKQTAIGDESRPPALMDATTVAQAPQPKQLPPCTALDVLGGTASTTGIDAIIEQAKGVLTTGTKPKAKGKTSKTIKSKGETPPPSSDEDAPDDDDGDDDDHDIWGEASDDSSIDSNEIQRKPASKMKRPAAKPDHPEVPTAVPMKRPAAKTDHPDEPPKKIAKKPAARNTGPARIIVPEGTTPKPHFKSAVHYRGGRIHFSKDKSAWRVYVRKKDKVEKTVYVDHGCKVEIAARWTVALNLINDDPRPRL